MQPSEHPRTENGRFTREERAMAVGDVPRTRRAGVIEYGLIELCAAVGVRSTETVTGVEVDMEHNLLRIHVESPWLPEVHEGAAAPVIDR